jgi:hypothetical protein
MNNLFSPRFLCGKEEGMSNQKAKLLLVMAVAILSVACGGQESDVVAKYFGAINQNDTQTLGGFAAVSLDKKVDAWKIDKISGETKVPTPLIELVKKQKEAEAKQEELKKIKKNYNYDHTAEIDQVLELRKKNAAVPAKLKPVADKVEEFIQRGKELANEISEAKRAVEKEKKIVLLSVGDVQNVEELTGEMVTKQLDLTLTIAGQARPYTMTMRRYDLVAPQNQRINNRWVIAALAPRS